MKHKIILLFLLMTILTMTACGKKSTTTTPGNLELSVSDSEYTSEALSSKKASDAVSETNDSSSASETDSSQTNVSQTDSSQILSSQNVSSASTSGDTSSNSSTFAPNNKSTTANVKPATTTTHQQISTSSDSNKSSDAHTYEKPTPSKPNSTTGSSSEVPNTTQAATKAPMPVPPTTKKEPEVTTSEVTTSPVVNNNVTITLSITCTDALNNSDLKSGITLPSDGIIIKQTSVTLENGATVFDALEKICQANNISYKYTGTAARKTIYIQSLNGLAEKDCGIYSGWKYSVNGSTPSVGCSLYTIKNGDIIEWFYSTTL